MADQIRATPRSPILGLFSDLVNLPLQYMSSPERTQQMQGTADFLYGTGIPKTLERASYGESLFSGAGGLGGTTRMRPETAEALMNVAPFAPAVGRVAGRMIKATEGLPVGMGIKDVGKSAITREGNPIQGAVVLVGDKIFMGRTHGDALNRAVYEGVVRKEGGKYIYPKDAEVNSDLFMTKDGQIIDRLQASKMFDIGASETAIEKGLMQNNPPKSMTVDSYIEEATALKKQREKSPYPQQAALDLAQQRAALPVEQGGLGLPVNNTAADRAKVMGIDTDAYHSTNASDITKFDLGKSSRGEGTSVALTPENAQAYGNITYPLKVDQQKIFDPTNKDQLKELKSYVENLIQQQKPYDKDSLSFYPFTSKKVLENLANPETGAYYLENEIISKSLKDLGYSGSIGMESGQSQLKIFNPDQIRSRFAAFDPFRRTAATAAAMGVAAPDLLAQPVNQEQPTYETIPMYTDPFANTIGSSIR